MGCERLDNGLTELVACDEWCVRAALTARFHKHTRSRACVCARVYTLYPLVQGLFVHAAIRWNDQSSDGHTHTYTHVLGMYPYVWAKSRVLKSPLQPGSIKIGVFRIASTALIHAHTLNEKEK